MGCTPGGELGVNDTKVQDTAKLSSGPDMGGWNSDGAFGGQAPQPVGCDCYDADPCTNDFCDEEGECYHEVLDCDDGIGCTIDTCELGECKNQPSVAMCGPVADCAEVICDPVAPDHTPEIRVEALPVSGCWALLDDSWCTDEWDGCACNGPEVCEARPASSSDPSGCVPAQTRDHWPCDESPFGDQNGCTEENCCEDWDPEGCRLHREAEAATPPDQVPPLKLFCDAVLESGEFAEVVVPGGQAYCAGGDLMYSPQWGLQVLSGLVGIEKPDGYWCEDCNPCTVTECDAPTGVCTAPGNVNDGNQIWPTKDVFEESYFKAVCPASADPACDNDSINYGCGRQECWDGLCRSAPNPQNEDPFRSQECHGYPVWPEGWGVSPATCYELGCENIASESRPNWTCVAHTVDQLCWDGQFCDGPGVCTVNALCDGCTAEELASQLASLPVREQAPEAGSYLTGCLNLTASQVCDDGIDCTIERCDERKDECSNHPDDRYCSENPQNWDPCHPGAQCLASGAVLACTPANNPCAGEKGCERSCKPWGTSRQCIAESGTCGSDCYQEGYQWIALNKLENLCPFMPTMPAGMDREYWGHGPEVEITVDLSISLDKHDVLATVRIEARETLASGNTVLEHEFAPMVVASSLDEIQYIVSDTTGLARGHSRDGGTAGIACGGCGIVDFHSFEGLIVNAEARGDTPNDDISHDSVCSDEVLIHSIEFAQIEVFTRGECAFLD